MAKQTKNKITLLFTKEPKQYIYFTILPLIGFLLYESVYPIIQWNNSITIYPYVYMSYNVWCVE